MQNLRNLLILLAFFALHLAAAAQPGKTFSDLICPLKLTAGQSDTVLVSDLFYAESYPLNFAVHPRIQVKYEQSTRKLTLTPAADFEGMTLLRFSLDDAKYYIAVQVDAQITHTFRYQPVQKPQKISVFGQFNAWNRSQLFLQDAEGNGIYELTVPIEPGRYEYKFFIDGAEKLDRANPDSVSNPFGSYNSILTVPPRHTDKTFLHIFGKTAADEGAQVSFFYERENQPAPLRKTDIIALLDNQRLDPADIKITGNRIDLTFSRSAPLFDKTLRIAVTQSGQTTPLQTIRLRELQSFTAADSFVWQDAILYAIMVDRFFDGDTSNSQPVQHPELSPKANFMGGDLQGILTKIEEGYFDSLGVNTLWISPINQNTPNAYREWPEPHRWFSGYHGYWPVHHEKVDKHFGDLALFQKLVKTAHAHGLRVLLDFVSNHVHQDHPFFRQHRDWFGSYDLPDGRKNIRLWDEYRLTTWFEPFLPSFDYLGSPQALQTMTDNAVWWMRETNIDGFRQDAVKHVPNRFWRELTRKIKREFGDAQKFQIGETFGSYELISSYVNNGQLNSQFNFNLYYTARYVFLSPLASFSALADELNKTHVVYGMNHLMGNLMDSHDQVRYLAFADGDLSLDSPDAQEIGWKHPPQVDHAESYQREKLYLAYLLTIPGVPTIYYGDEIGMSGAADPDNRRMMRFGKNVKPAEKEVFRDVSKLIKLRREHSALRHGDFQVLHADQNTFVYLRSDLNERVLVALNKSEQPQEIAVNLPKFYELTIARDLLSGQKMKISENNLLLNIPRIGWQILEVNK